MSFGINISHFNTNNDYLVNYHQIVNKFCDLYYSGMANKGLSSLLYLFDQNAICNYNGFESIGVYGLLAQLSSEHISRIIYDKLSCSYVTLKQSSDLLIQVNGLCKGVNFAEYQSNIFFFSDTFVLTNINGNFIVSSYIFKVC